MTSPSQITERTGHPGIVRCLTFSRDGRTLAWVSQNRSIVFWDITHNQTRAIINVQADTMICLGFSPDGKEITFFEHPFAGDNQGYAKVIDLHGGAEQLTEKLYIASGLAWHPSG